MKVLYLCADHGIPILGTKGASVHVRELASALMSRGHQVHVVCAKRGEGNDPGALSISEVSSLADVRRRGDAENANRILTRELAQLEYNSTLKRELDSIIADFQPAVIYERYSLFSYAGTLGAKQHNLLHLVEINAPLIQERQASSGLILTNVAQQIEDEVFTHADALITVSSLLAQYAIERGAEPGRVTVIPNGVDLSTFKPSTVQDSHATAHLESLGLPIHISGQTVIGFVGSLKPWHGIDILLQAFARARQADPQLFLLIVGEGPQLEELKSLAQREGLTGHVHFSGAAPHRLIPRYIDVMDITLAPYRKRADFYFSPLKISEYMAMGKPVIATRQGQITELVRDGENGLLCEPDSVDSLASAMLRLSGNRDLQHRLGENGAAIVQDHSWLRIADRVTQLCESLTANAGAGDSNALAYRTPVDSQVRGAW